MSVTALGTSKSGPSPAYSAAVWDAWGWHQADLGPHTVSAIDSKWVRFVGRSLGEKATEMTDGLVTWLAELFPRVTPPTGDLTPLADSVHDNMVTLWSMVANGLEPDAVEPPPNALLWPRKMIHARVPLGTLMRVYYVGHAMIWHRWVQPQLDELTATGVDTNVVSARLHALLFNYLDRAALRVAEQYHAARLELMETDQRAKQAAVYDILAGARPTPQLRTSLGFDLDEPHRAWILWLPNAAADLAPLLESMAERVHGVIRDSASASATLTLQNGQAEIWGWTSVHGSIGEGARAELARLCGTRPDQTARGSVFRLAVAAPADGVGGFRGGHEEASSLRTAMDRARSSPSVATSEEAGLAALLLADPQNAYRFAHRSLGPLAAPTRTAASLRSTLQVFLSHARSFQRTAERLGVHRNTVLQRIRRCETELGRQIDAGERDTAAALLILDWLPDND